MYWSTIVWAALGASLASFAYGQQSGWQENQVNATMCTWQSLRAAVLKDTVYLDGGFLWWVPGLSDGSYGLPAQDNNPLGLIYTLNFSTPFNTTTNVSEILNVIPKANGNAANNLAPNYYDGALLANNDEFFLYGGLLSRTDSYSAPDGDDVFEYQASRYGAEQGSFKKGFLNYKLPDGVTRYVTYGGAANAPSENKAWYFGGYKSPSGGPVYYPSSDPSLNPTNVSDTLITLDMAEQSKEVWTNATLPDDIPSRANPSVVWVPVGAQGILVVLGGVSYPNYNNPTLKSQNEAQSDKDGPTYMSNVNIYDIANDKWYVQPTIAAPPGTALGCAVVAWAQDYSSYNIYYYGGYNGVNGDADFDDDVWILSLPSFMWMKVSSGTAAHARAGHQCVMPYPDQMITIGGFTPAKTEGMRCLDGGILEVFNLTEGRWMDSYDPDEWSEYGVPEMIHLMIGGDFTGGATMTTPTPTGWATTELASVFATAYPTEKMRAFYPYGSAGPGGSGRGNVSSGGGTPSWVAPVLGVVLGLVFVTAIVVGILLYRRRRLLRKNGSSENPPDENRHRILSWVNGQSNDKAATVTTDDPSSHIDDMESRNITPMYQYKGAVAPPPPTHQVTMMSEMPDTPLVELMDTSQPLELGDTGLPYTDVIEKHSALGTNPNSPLSISNPATQPSSFLANSSVSRDQASSISSSHIPPPPPAAYPHHRPDSPSILGSHGSHPPPSPRNAVVSDASRISERDISHLRNISDVSNSSSVPDSAGVGSPPGSPQPAHSVRSYQQQPGPGQLSSPLASPPPTSAADGRDVPDYVSIDIHRHGSGRSVGSARSGSARGIQTMQTATSSPLRRSVFRESTDDLGDSDAGQNNHFHQMR